VQAPGFFPPMSGSAASVRSPEKPAAQPIERVSM
jgi:hypothetical protein